jgi:hypothetical protein
MSTPKMASFASGDKINFDFDIKVMKNLLQTIHSEDLIHRQPSEAQRSAYAETVSELEEKLTETENLLSKRHRCGWRMKRFLSCHDELYEQVVMLKSELHSVYSNLQNNAMYVIENLKNGSLEKRADDCSPQIDVQEPSPERSLASKKSESSSSQRSQGLWMKGKASVAGMAGERERSENEEMKDTENVDI